VALIVHHGTEVGQVTGICQFVIIDDGRCLMLQPMLNEVRADKASSTCNQNLLQLFLLLNIKQFAFSWIAFPLTERASHIQYYLAETSLGIGKNPRSQNEI
jgi:hypothetical protein